MAMTVNARAVFNMMIPLRRRSCAFTDVPSDRRSPGETGQTVQLPMISLTRMPLIELGRTAPAFNLKDQRGHAHRLADYAGRPVVLFFYPKDDTPGCTKEACAFRDALRKFAAHKAVVLGISGQNEASKAKFAAKYDLTFPLLADEGYEVAEKYGVWQKKLLYGRTFMGISRTTFLIGPDGKVVKRWDKVKVDGHAEEVLKALELRTSKSEV